MGWVSLAGIARSGTVLGAAYCSSRCPSLAGPACRSSRTEPLHSLPESRTPHFLRACTRHLSHQQPLRQGRPGRARFVPAARWHCPPWWGRQGTGRLHSLHSVPRGPFKAPAQREEETPFSGWGGPAQCVWGPVLAPLVVQPIWTQVVCTAVSAL